MYPAPSSLTQNVLSNICSTGCSEVRHLYLVGVESLESLAGKRSALRPLLGDGPRRGAIRGERERLLDDLKRSCLGESDRDLLLDVRNKTR